SPASLKGQVEPQGKLRTQPLSPPTSGERGGAWAHSGCVRSSLPDRCRSPSQASGYLPAREAALPPPSWTLHHCRRPRDGGPEPQGSEGGRGADSRAEADPCTAPFLTPHSPAQLSSPRSLPETPAPSQPSTLPLSESHFLEDPFPDPGPLSAPFPTPYLPHPHIPSSSADCRFSQSFLLGFLSRTQPGLSKSCRGAFQSPRPSPKSGQADGASEDSLHLDIQKLKEKRDLLDKEISQFISEGYSVDELEDHISRLHEYNDIKDAGQMLLGKLAVIRGVTTKELYPEFGLDMND
uniref:DNA repair protein SWI5 homolog n=1 Tax=Suricata suricatta TaxID=37032 RepID=A0A673U1Z3_SURSU